ncbi:MAG TPA: urease accessory protein UreF [Burkholderiaceae bacterium]|nr:urease accessory protein UreF [Burkholderiaceae bacterium]
MRLASPALPVGGFSYSEVLEAAIENGRVTNAETARAWLLDQLRLGLTRCELPLLAAAHDAWSRRDFVQVAALNTWATTVRETRELQLQAQQMGRSLLDWLRRRHEDDGALAHAAALQPAPTWPVVFALAAVRAGAPLNDSLIAFALGWAENMVQAAIKAVPLGQSAGQRLLDALAAELPAAVDAALVRPPEQRQAFAPMLAILSAQHETQYSRLFRS